MHLLDGLPEEWVVQRDTTGRVSAIKDTVIAGFLRNGLFYTREQAAAAPALITRDLSPAGSAFYAVVLGTQAVLFQQGLQV